MGVYQAVGIHESHHGICGLLHKRGKISFWDPGETDDPGGDIRGIPHAVSYGRVLGEKEPGIGGRDGGRHDVCVEDPGDPQAGGEKGHRWKGFVYLENRDQTGRQ